MIGAIGNPIYKDLVLIGGGHAHVIAARAFSMRPLKNLRVTLISDQYFAPYSGMLPGHLAGWYTFDQCHFDLARICAQAGIRFICDEVVALDTTEQKIRLKNRPPLDFDVVSINVGSRPTLTGATEGSRLIPLKPISQFLSRWKGFLDEAKASSDPLRVAIVGGGASGVEIAFIVENKLVQARKKGRVILYQASSTLLPAHGESAQSRLMERLAARNIEVRLGQKVESYKDGELRLASGRTEPVDYVFWATQAAAPAWFRESGLPVNESGFLQVDEALRALGLAHVYGAGDCIQFSSAALAKSGVYAVRQGSILATNLRRHLREKGNPRRYRPQKSALALITLGEKDVVASWGRFSLRGPWLWKLKDFIDTRFMERFQNPREAWSLMSLQGPASVAQPRWLTDSKPNSCGGCGAKLPPQLLESVLSQVRIVPNEDVIVGLKKADDAAVVCPPGEQYQVSSVDQFRTFTADSFVLGQVGAYHALNDIYAMGARPQTAQCLVTLPADPEPKQKQEMVQLLSGVCAALESEKVTLTGGHSMEGAETTVGFSVLGWVPPNRIWKKRGAQIGDALILTKSLGSGAILAAQMKGHINGRWIQELHKRLIQAPGPAYEILKDVPIHAGTDVTGFGLLGHLLEMLMPESLTAVVDSTKVPVLPGVAQLLGHGVEASIAPANAQKVLPFLLGPDGKPVAKADLRRRWGALIDPQTNGGFLVAVAQHLTGEIIPKLKAAGFIDATVIGHISGRRTSAGTETETYIQIR